MQHIKSIADLTQPHYPVPCHKLVVWRDTDQNRTGGERYNQLTKYCVHIYWARLIREPCRRNNPRQQSASYHKETCATRKFRQTICI